MMYVVKGEYKTCWLFIMVLSAAVQVRLCNTFAGLVEKLLFSPPDLSKKFKFNFDKVYPRKTSLCNFSQVLDICPDIPYNVIVSDTITL